MGALVSTTVGLVATLASPVIAVPGTAGPWRPPQWNTPGTLTPPLTITASGANGQQTAYVFDGTMRIEHNQNLELTKNPVQTGAAITDNAYLIPPSFTAEMLMSDSMQSFTIGQFSGAASRSVSAFQTLVNLQATLTPVQCATRLRQYSNMMIKAIHAPDDKDTKFGLKVIVTFEQILTASVSQTVASSTASSGATSAIPQSTGSTTTGQVQTTPVTPSIQSQNNIANAPTVGN